LPEALTVIGQPCCGRCGAPAAFEVYGSNECRNRDFWFDGARASSRYKGVGEEIVHALKYRGYLPVVGKAMAPLMASSLGGRRFEGWCRCRCTFASREAWFNQAELMAGGWSRG
jgi:predicted amidophosphoribosyltransferase